MTTAVNEARERLYARIRQHSDRQIIDCIHSIGGGDVSRELRLVRSALLVVYEERFGGDAVDLLMDEIGM